MNRRKTDQMILSVTRSTDTEKTLVDILNVYKTLKSWQKSGYKIIAMRERGYMRDFEDIAV